MRAFAVASPGAEPALTTVPEPVAGPNAVLVRVTCASVNPIDWKQLGRADEQRTYPFVLGQDFAGVVEGVGDGVTAFAPGDRMFGIAREHGAYAERTAVRLGAQGEPVARIPDGVDDASAATLPTAGLTAYAALETLALQPGETLLVLGALGGVGGFAVQLARERGVRVIGTVEAAKTAQAKQLGVDVAIAYDRDDVTATVRAAAAAGVDAVLDLVDDGEHVRATAGMLRPGGRIVSTIGATDEAWFAERGFRATNLVLFETPQASPEGLERLASLVRDGKLDVRIAHEVPLDAAGDALAQSRGGKVEGKLVLRVAPASTHDDSIAEPAAVEREATVLQQAFGLPGDAALATARDRVLTGWPSPAAPSSEDVENERIARARREDA